MIDLSIEIKLIWFFLLRAAGEKNGRKGEVQMFGNHWSPDAFG